MKMNTLKELRERYRSTNMKAEEALKEIFDTYLIEDSLLELHGLKIKYVDYGLHRLKQNGDYLMEGEKTECLERAYEIINRIDVCK